MATTAEQVDRFNPPIPTPQEALANLLSNSAAEGNLESVALIQLIQAQALKTEATINRLATFIGFTPAAIELLRYGYFLATNSFALELTPTPEAATTEFIIAMLAITCPLLFLPSGVAIGKNAAQGIMRQAVLAIDNAGPIQPEDPNLPQSVS